MFWPIQLGYHTYLPSGKVLTRDEFCWFSLTNSSPSTIIRGQGWYNLFWVLVSEWEREREREREREKYIYIYIWIFQMMPSHYHGTSFSSFKRNGTVLSRQKCLDRALLSGWGLKIFKRLYIYICVCWGCKWINENNYVCMSVCEYIYIYIYI